MAVVMDYKELLEKYKILLGEVNHLTEENNELKSQIGLLRSQLAQGSGITIKPENNYLEDDPINSVIYSDVNNSSDSLTKIRLFMSLFKGRSDVYAKRWENKNKGTSGYSPVCLNQWQTGVCGKPKEDFPPKDHTAIQKTLDLLTDSRVSVVFKSNIHQKFAVMDQKVVWYGSINLLSYGSAQESIMRIESANIANELMRSIEVHNR